MANLIIISGPIAVGKMTVAKELRKILVYNLMINHDSIEASDKIFGFGTASQEEFNEAFRKAAFTTTIKYDESMIFTIAYNFDKTEHRKLLNELILSFEKNSGVIRI